MKCPYCNSEMEQGFLHSGRRIFWSKKDRNYIFIPHPKKDDIALTRTVWQSDWQGGKSSYLCRKCNRIMIDLNGSPGE